jgi:hypothetical protein
MRDNVTERGWLASIVVIAGILLLAAGGEIPRRTGGDPSIGGRLASLVTCVLPQPAASPPSTSASPSKTGTADCAEPAPYNPNRAAITC